MLLSGPVALGLAVVAAALVELESADLGTVLCSAAAWKSRAAVPNVPRVGGLACPATVRFPSLAEPVLGSSGGSEAAGPRTLSESALAPGALWRGPADFPTQAGAAVEARKSVRPE